MTDCPNAEIRDLLPDLAADALSPVERTRVQAHVDGCVECAAEVTLLQTARAVRPQIGPINVARIVAQLPRPVTRASVREDPAVLAHNARRTVAPAHRLSAARASRSVWRMAAAIGVIIAGGWSVVLVRSGGLTMVANGRTDTAQFADAVERANPTATTPTGTPSTTLGSVAASVSGVTVSFGDLGDYTDEELQRVLDRLDKWDGATSTEAMTTPPILPTPRGGTLE